jgi:glucose-6-phosphate isomerase
LAHTAVVVSSKSGSTVETDSQRRVFAAAFAEAGIDPAQRIIVVTDPGSPLDVSARADGYRVFNADPNVGGRFSALTAFGLVPAGLAGVDISQLLDEAAAASADAGAKP